VLGQDTVGLSRVVAPAGLVAIALAAWGPGCESLEPTSAGVDRSEAKRTRTRFGRLTSKVWRYRAPFEAHDLRAVPNNNPHPEPQPKRDRPRHVALNAAGTKLYVALSGTEAAPGNEIAVVDVRSERVLQRIGVGRRPIQPVLHPGGRFLLVVNELSNYISVIDTFTDGPATKIPADYYCQDVAMSPEGDRAWVSNRYLDQVLVVDLDVSRTSLTGRVREVGGFDELAFYGATDLPADIEGELLDRGYSPSEIQTAVGRGTGGINAILRARCKNCHHEGTGGFVSGADAEANLLSAVENSVAGKPYESPLLRAVIPVSMGGFGDSGVTPEYHLGGAMFYPGDPDLERIAAWIAAADQGPGILVGNRGSNPKALTLAPDGKHLFVGNTGTMDVSIVDVETNREVGGIYMQNLTNALAIYRDPRGERDLLITHGLGAGFGATKGRDPHGGETWDRDHPAAQFSVLRDPKTTDAYPIKDQFVLGPYDAVDGTWNLKMRDIQNDVVAIDLSRLAIPKWQEGMRLNYVLRANKYEAHEAWVRYTSDTVEATAGDFKGDIPPELQRVHGSFAEEAVIQGDRMYAVMAGSFEVVEWQIDPDASDPANKLVPLRKFDVGLRPIGIAAGSVGPAANKLFVTNALAETLSIIDLATTETKEIVVGDLTRPALDTDAEKGELVVHTSVFTSDGDTSCLHCHYRDTGDGRGWGAAETVGQDKLGRLTPGGTLGIPQMRNIYAIQPYYFEGTHKLGEGQGADINEPASSIDFDREIWAGDFSKISSPVPMSERREMHEELKERVSVKKLGPVWYDLEERRDQFLKQQAMRYFDSAQGLADYYRFVAAWLGANTHLMPNPLDTENPSVKRGKALFHSVQVMCSVCHTAPEFTNKSAELANNDRRALPPLTTITRRDASYTLISVHAMEVANGRHFDLSPEDKGRVEDVEGSFTTMQLRGIFDRPPVFLHHARARSLREVLLTPGHPAAREYRYPVLQGDEDVRPGRREKGFNEITTRTPAGPLHPTSQIFDSHGGTSHLTPRQITDLEHFVESIE